MQRNMNMLYTSTDQIMVSMIKLWYTLRESIYVKLQFINNSTRRLQIYVCTMQT